MSNEFYLAKGDTSPSIVETLSQSGSAINLTSCTVRFHLRNKVSSTRLIDAAAVIDNAATGQVHYDWQTGDTDTPGTYWRQWEITLPSGKKVKVPNDRLGGYPVVISEIA